MFKRLRKSATPKLGQHFLTSHDIARAIVRAGNVQDGDTVIEVGPGRGILTRELIDAGANVIAIEKDHAMTHIIYDMFLNEIKDGRLQVVEADARDFLKREPESGNLKAPYKIIANIPYYITGELLRLFLSAERQPEVIALLVQKEVAERVARSIKESILSLSVKAYGEPRYVRTVKAGSFNPPPSVSSAILAITDISRKNFAGGSGDASKREKTFFELVHAGFGQKRKTLLGNLKRKYPTSDVGYFEDIWKELGLNAKVRAEDVPLKAWLELTSKLTARGF